jgi:hypothetical protein
VEDTVTAHTPTLSNACDGFPPLTHLSFSTGAAVQRKLDHERIIERVHQDEEHVVSTQLQPHTERGDGGSIGCSDATATATGEQTETLSSTRQRLERSLLPSSTPTRRASPSSTSPATPRRRLSSPARPTTKAGSSTPAPFHPTSRSSDERRRRQPGRPGERPRRSGDGLVMKLKQKRRPVEPTMGLGNLVANGEAGTRRGRQPTTSAVASFLQEISNTGLLTKEQEITYTVEAQVCFLSPNPLFDGGTTTLGESSSTRGVSEPPSRSPVRLRSPACRKTPSALSEVHAVTRV